MTTFRESKLNFGWIIEDRHALEGFAFLLANHQQGEISRR